MTPKSRDSTLRAAREPLARDLNEPPLGQALEVSFGTILSSPEQRKLTMTLVITECGFSLAAEECLSDEMSHTGSFQRKELLGPKALSRDDSLALPVLFIFAGGKDSYFLVVCKWGVTADIVCQGGVSIQHYLKY